VKKNIIYKTNFSNLYLNKKKFKLDIKKINMCLEEILKNSFKKDNLFNSLNTNLKLDIRLKNKKIYKKFNDIVIIGMGGSIMGADAIHSFLKHKIKKNILFLDNLDEFQFKKLKKLKKPLFLIISKSGDTIETLTNLSLIKKVTFSKKNTIIITERKNNALMEFSKKNNINIIDHKNYIGGRYSVLSEVGMIPAFLMGLKIINFKKNLNLLFKEKKKLLQTNVSNLSQIYLSKKINSIIFFNYDKRLIKFSYWCQQLIAESLGKKKLGLLPIVSIGPKDHHSLLQLYLDGPKDKIFYIMSAKSSLNLITENNYFGKKYNHINKKKLSKIILSQKNAFIKELNNKKIPFREIHINKFDEETIGELFGYFILETVLLGRLIKVNPFDQPAVESVKIYTKKNLKN
jgi:glucose-6-phosphate isomerase